MKGSLQSIEDRVNYLEYRQKELFEEIRFQIQGDKEDGSVNSIGKDSLQMNDHDDIQKQTKPKTVKSYTPTRFNQPLTKKTKARQSFFRVSEVDDVISDLIDSKGY